MRVGLTVLNAGLRCDAPQHAQGISDARASGARKSNLLIVTFLADFLVLLLDPSHLKRTKNVEYVNHRFKHHKTIVEEILEKIPTTTMKTQELFHISETL